MSYRVSKRKLMLSWLYARRAIIAYIVAVYAVFYIVYALYGYEWGVAGYAALLGFATGAGFAVWDYARFASQHKVMTRICGHFPTTHLPEPRNLQEKDTWRVIEALEAERARLERETELIRRDAMEYYTLWVHQIKTPIAAMRLLLQSGACTGMECKPALDQELFRIEQYAGMALQYQRLSSMQNDLVFQEFDLERLVKKAAKACATLFISKKLPLHVESMKQVVVTDEKWFCFVLEQILTNAVKYTHSGGIRAYAADEETLAIEDSGIGIMAEDLPRVFERGFTGAAGRSERSSTGIGLYLCREILTRLGFDISISSVPGQGTRVLLHLRQNPLELE